MRQMWVKIFAGNIEIEITGESGTLKGAIEMAPDQGVISLSVKKT